MNYDAFIQRISKYWAYLNGTKYLILNIMKILIKTLMILLCACIIGCRNDKSSIKNHDNESIIQASDPLKHEIPGILLENQTLRVRIIDNRIRYNSNLDGYLKGMNGLAALIHADQRKNIFATVGMNLEMTETEPPYGEYQDTWNAPG